MAIGGGVAIISTAFAMPSAIASMTCMPTLKGVMNGISGDGGGVYTSVIAETVVADAGGGAEMLDASPMVTAATNAITAQPRHRVTRNTGESCPKNRPRHSEKRRMLPRRHRRHSGHPGQGRADRTVCRFAAEEFRRIV